MRCTIRPILGMLLAAAMGSGGFCQETKAPWWHFGRDKEVASAPAAVTPAPSVTPSLGVTPSPTFTPSPTITPEVAPVEDESWVKWPKMPKMTWLEPKEETIVTDPFASTPPATTQPRQSRSQYGNQLHRTRPKNTWAQQPASSTTIDNNPSAWKSMTNGTKSAWHKTVDWVTPCDSASEAPVVADDTLPSWWASMWGAEDESQGPQTVTEWMAQDRIDP
jgi:hypothetical protein